MRGLICSSLFLLIMPAALAGSDRVILLERDAEAKISVGCLLRDLPPSGYAPIVVNINNDSARPQTWSFQFNSPNFSYWGNRMTFAIDLSVPRKSTRTFNILVPLALRQNDFSDLGVTVSGPWTNVTSRQQFSTDSRRYGKPPTAFVAMSETLAAPSWSQLEKELEDLKKDLVGTRFNPDELPDDWRALAGIAGLWLTVEELNLLGPAQRAALREWVHRGGSLFVHGAGDLDPQFRSTGFGKVTKTPEATLDLVQTVAAIQDLNEETLETQVTQDYKGYWKAADTLGPIKLNASLLIGLMALFAVVAGPVNLFVFARRTHRHRLFWTTPLISVAATAAILILIIWHDGLGGSGVRTALIYVAATEKQDVVLQEQIARTGVLLSSSFVTRDPSYIAPISRDSSQGRVKNAYENSGTSFTGDYFLSRTVQAHWIESIAPTREGIVFANPTTTGEAASPPVIVSNIGSVLEKVYFRDESGRTWRASNVQTGQRVTMESEGQMPDLLPAEAGPRLSTMWNRVKDRTGYFYAISHESNSLVGTLPSIRWKNDSVIYLGPLSNPGPRL